MAQVPKLSESILSVPPLTGYPQVDEPSNLPDDSTWPQGTPSLGATEAPLAAPLQNQLVQQGSSLTVGAKASISSPPANSAISIAVNATSVSVLEPPNLVATSLATKPGTSVAVNPAQVKTGPSW
jgi:hypothetical protein